MNALSGALPIYEVYDLIKQCVDYLLSPFMALSFVKFNTDKYFRVLMRELKDHSWRYYVDNVTQYNELV